MKEKPAHYCHDWDFLFVKPNDPEMDCCNCKFVEEIDLEQEEELKQLHLDGFITRPKGE